MVLLDNFLYKLAALLMAVVLWATAQGFQSEEQSIDLPIALVDVPEDLVVVDQSSEELNLRIAGSRAAVRQAHKQLLRYTVSLAGAQAPEFRSSVRTPEPPRGARVAAFSPTTLVVQLDVRARRRVIVKPDLVGELPAGLRLDAVQVEPDRVVLEGARSSIRRVREVLTDRIDLARVQQTTTLEVPLNVGLPHVWQSGADTPVRVQLQIARDPPPLAEEPTGEDAA